jgi:polysaccharide biosynthesis transport protein
MTSLQSIVVNIRDALAVVSRHRWLIVAVFLVLMTASVLVISKIPRTYQATANVLIVNGNSRNDPTLSSPDLPSIVGSTVVLEHVQQNLGIATPLLTMKKQLVAKPPAYRSGIMRIQYTDSDPNRAAMVANGIADELARYYSELSTARYDDDLRALDDELSKQKRRLENIDAQIRAQGGDDYVATDEKNDDAPGSQLNALESQRALANAELQGDIAHAQAAAVDVQHGILLSDPVYEQLQASLSKASAELADARSRYTAQYPGLPALQDRVDSLKAAAAQEADRALSSARATAPIALAASSDESKARASVEADRAKVTALDQELASENKDLKVASSLELLQLARDEDLREYQSIVARRATSLADRADALSLGSVEVVDRAIASEAQSGIGRTRLTLTALFIVAILAFGSAFLADQLDPSLRRATQIEALYGKPLIATLTTSHRERE